MSDHYFDEHDTSMSNLRTLALVHCLESMKSAFIDDSYLSRYHTEIPVSWSDEPLAMTCSSFLDNSGCRISEANNVLINLRFPSNTGSYFIDLFKDEVSLGVCGSTDVTYRNFTVLKDLDLLKNKDEEVIFQYKTLYDILDLTEDEISYILEIADLIREYR